MKKLIDSLVERHLLVNIFFVGVLAAGLFAWRNINKEEMPDFESNTLRVQATFQGAAAEEVESLVTIPIERQLKAISGIGRITSNSSIGAASIAVELDKSAADQRETITAIKEAVDRAILPAEVRDEIRFRQFKTTEKAIIDLAIYSQDDRHLNAESRAAVQSYARELENKLTNLNVISRADKQGYLARQLQIKIDHQRLQSQYVPLGQVLSTLKKVHQIAPSGSLQDRFETKVSIISRFVDAEKLRQLVVRSNTDGNLVRLGEVATVEDSFEKNTGIIHVQGREAVILNVRKSINADILEAREAVLKLSDELAVGAASRGIKILPMDDESFDVRNRIKIVGSNGILGFILIVLTLIVFLDWRSGFWTAAGIPFSLAATVVIALMAAYSVNNITLAAIIIVLGIVVDDAIIVSENVSRYRKLGLSPVEAASKGAYELIGPILAAILTTCAAFFPLIFFEGRIGAFIKFIPLLIIAMLGASFIESIFILPSHLSVGKRIEDKQHWFDRYEQIYARILVPILNGRWLMIGAFVAMLVGTLFLYKSQMQFVLFSEEEAKEVYLKAIAEDKLTKYEMADKLREVETVLMHGYEAEIVAVRTSIARSRRGGEVKENQAFIRVELQPKDVRSRGLKGLTKEWEGKFSQLSGYKELAFIRHRFGSSSGSPIAIEVRENDEKRRAEVVALVKTELEKVVGLEKIEVEAPLRNLTYELRPQFDQITLAGVDPETLVTSARTYLNGVTAYSFVEDDEEVDVILGLRDRDKESIEQVTKLMIENKQGFLVRLAKLIKLEKIEKATTINRINHKRTTEVFADLTKGKKQTPLTIAAQLEESVFPAILAKFPTVALDFAGEIKETRESGSDFVYSIIIVLVLIYAILIMLYNSMLLPFVVMLIIPFGFVGVVWAFFLHGKELFGFMAVVGMIGMIGVVVNDAIIMLAKLEGAKIPRGQAGRGLLAEVASTRLRAITVTTVTTLAGLLPTAYGIVGFDAMLSEMMLAMGWGLAFGTLITLFLTPCLYSLIRRI